MVSPLNSTQTPSVQHISSTPLQPPKSHSSTPKPRQFHTKNPSVSHQKPLSSTPKKGHCKARSYIAFLVWNWGGGGSEGFLELNWGVFGLELRDFWGWKGVAFLCEADVLNWGGPFGSWCHTTFLILILPKFSALMCKFWGKLYLLPLGKTNHVSLLGRN